MKKTRHTAEQIVRMLRQAEAKLAAGSSVEEVGRELGVSEATFYRWRNRYGGMSTQEAKRLKDLEKENARLKRLLAEKELDIDEFANLKEAKVLAEDYRDHYNHHRPHGALGYLTPVEFAAIEALADQGSGPSEQLESVQRLSL